MARIKNKLNMIKSLIAQLLSLYVSKKDIFGSNLHSQLLMYKKKIRKKKKLLRSKNIMWIWE